MICTAIFSLSCMVSIVWSNKPLSPPRELWRHSTLGHVMHCSRLLELLWGEVKCSLIIKKQIMEQVICICNKNIFLSDKNPLVQKWTTKWWWGMAPLAAERCKLKKVWWNKLIFFIAHSWQDWCYSRLYMKFHSAYVQLSIKTGNGKKLAWLCLKSLNIL